MKGLLTIFIAVNFFGSQIIGQKKVTHSFLSNGLFEIEFDSDKYFLYDNDLLRNFNKHGKKNAWNAYIGGLGLQTGESGPVILFQLIRKFDSKCNSFEEFCNYMFNEADKYRNKDTGSEPANFICDSRNNVIKIDNKTKNGEFHRGYLFPTTKGLIFIHIYHKEPLSSILKVCGDMENSVKIYDKFKGLPSYSNWEEVDWSKVFAKAISSMFSPF